MALTSDDLPAPRRPSIISFGGLASISSSLRIDSSFRVAPPWDPGSRPIARSARSETVRRRGSAPGMAEPSYSAQTHPLAPRPHPGGGFTGRAKGGGFLHGGPAHGDPDRRHSSPREPLRLRHPPPERGSHPQALRLDPPAARRPGRGGGGPHAADVPGAHHRRPLPHHRAAHRGAPLHARRHAAPDHGHGEEFTYSRLLAAARMAETRGARIMGLGAFTKVVGDAGMTVARESELPITSGNSLTVAATLEAAKQAVVRMGVKDLTRGRAMIVGATGAIGAVCSRLIAAAIRDVVLVSIEPERLAALQRIIEEETPGAQVVTATSCHELIGECDLVVTATSAFGQRVIDISRCKPGAVVCDVALPRDISRAEADLRPDVLVVEGGEV